MFLFKLLIFSNLVFLPAALASRDCSTIDVFDKYKGDSDTSIVMRDFFSKPRNQDSWGLCYAFTAADILSFELNVPVSALHVSAKYEEKKELQGEPYEEGGLVEEAIDSIHPLVCSEKDLPNHTNLKVYRSKEIRKMIETVQRLKNSSRSQEKFKLCQEIAESGISNFPELNFSDFADVLLQPVNDKPFTIVNKLAERNCKEKILVPELKLAFSKNAGPFYEIVNGEKIRIFGGPQEKDAALSYLDRGLEKGKLVSIGYQPVEMLNLEADDPNVLHASTVSGRKMVKGKCMYVVRNSWGNSPCGNQSVPEGIVCGTKEGQNVPYGSFMVSRETLKRYIQDSSYVE